MTLKTRELPWQAFRVGLFLSALTLAIYIPFKYLTQLHAIHGLYALLFPLSSLLAIAGMVLAFRPNLAFSFPLWARAGLATLSAGWIATGILCIPSLIDTTLAAPLAGMIAALHMLGQHVFLSFSLTFLLLAPRSIYGLFRMTPPERPENSKAPLPRTI